MSGGRNRFTKTHANLVFQACMSVLSCFRAPGVPIRKILVYSGCCPVFSLNGLKICKFVSRSIRCHSDLVLDAGHSWIFNLILFYRRASRFVVFQTKWRIFVFALFA